MSPTLYTITLQGRQSESYNKVRSELQNEILRFQYPLRIEELVDSTLTQLSYRDEVISFNQNQMADGINQMKALLRKINPNTGKICRCKDCKNCPSKIYEAMISAT